MEDFQVEIPEIEVPEVEFCDVETEMDYELEMEDENVVDIEDGESETERQSRPKAQNPNRQIQQNRQKHQSPRKVQVKVNDYLRCSVMTVTLCNCLFLGTAALMCSLKAVNRKYKRDVNGAKKFSCCALAANIFAIITTIITIIVVSLVLPYSYKHRC
ncbi:hypothetical protein ABG768_019594 [Culter alburnus]|uniref:Uncharacterized protein n=1 Tax=Culter alburnus TaxID=194366 RepID=A0AAW2AYF5_CULAL